MNKPEINTVTHLVESNMNRRKILTASIAALVTSPAAFATASLEDKPKIVRLMATWNEPEGLWRCWLEGQATTVQQVLLDAQSLFSERAAIQLINTQDLELILGQPARLDIPEMRVGCASGYSTSIAFDAALHLAGGDPVRWKDRNQYAGWVLTSANKHEHLLESWQELNHLLKQRYSESLYFGHQYLLDNSLAYGTKRVSVLIAKKPHAAIAINARENDECPMP